VVIVFFLQAAREAMPRPAERFRFGETETPLLTRSLAELPVLRG
jgi:hypothetical protein